MKHILVDSENIAWSKIKEISALKQDLTSPGSSNAMQMTARDLII
jgi:hypothetical protein